MKTESKNAELYKLCVKVRMNRIIWRLGQLGRRQAGPVSFCFLIPVRSYSMCPQTNSELVSKLPFPG